MEPIDLVEFLHSLDDWLCLALLKYVNQINYKITILFFKKKANFLPVCLSFTKSTASFYEAKCIVK